MRSVTYQLGVADLVDARIYSYNSLPVVRATRVIIGAGTAAAVAYGAYLALQGRFDDLVSEAWWITILVALTVWMKVGNRLLVPLSARKQLARSFSLRDEIQMSWDDDRAVLRTNHGEIRWQWPELYRWQESRGCLLLWSGNQIYHPLPKRVLTAGQLDNLRNTLTSALGKPGAKRK